MNKTSSPKPTFSTEMNHKESLSRNTLNTTAKGQQSLAQCLKTNDTDVNNNVKMHGVYTLF